MQAARSEIISEEAYLQGEELALERHEYVAGEVFAMTGASRGNNQIAGNVLCALRRHLRGKPCRTYINDIKVKIRADSIYYYPDVLVTCDPRDLGEGAPTHYVEHPSLVVEVTSPTTESIDRREKLTAYRHLPSLVEYLLIDQDRRAVDLYRKVGPLWTHVLVQDGETLELESVAMDIDVAEIYSETDVT